MNGIKDLFDGERGLLAFVLIVAATTLAGLDRMSIDQWQEFSTYIFGIFVGGKSLTTAAGLLAAKGATPVAAAPVTPATPVAPAAPATPAVTTP
jgi:hypothetical protein